VAMCGDMAGEAMLTWVLIGLGLRNLSMAPRQIPVVKAIVRATRIADAERLLAKALTMATETEIEELVYTDMRKRFPLELGDPEEERSAG
jgi:phosphotransferase system enzyme I (PtsI)